MGKIYQRAQHVIGWLGDDRDLSSLFRLLNFVARERNRSDRQFGGPMWHRRTGPLCQERILAKSVDHPGFCSVLQLPADFVTQLSWRPPSFV
jgi:hypothetical protein